MTDLAPEVALETGPRSQDGRTTEGSGTDSGVRRWLSKRWVLILGEVVVSVGAALGYTMLCRHISVNPLIRIGQVSGLAKLQQYVAFLGLPLLAALLYTAYRGSLWRHQVVKRLVCAALAGLSTGVIAGGIVVALRGTPWPLGGQEGDPGTLLAMANELMRGKYGLGVYPPGFPAAMALWAKIRYGGIGGAGFALHDLQIFFSALVGPMAYLAWRLVLRPFWALLIAVPAAVVFLDPIRPYSHVVMLVLIPLIAVCLRELRRISDRTVRGALLLGAGLGAVFGLLFLWYSGWYLWAAPGVVLLALVFFPWRRGRAAAIRAVAYLGAALGGFAVVGAPLLFKILDGGAGTQDHYAYISVYLDPAYVMGWLSDRSGDATYLNYPVAGELAGQTGFAVLLLAGVGLGIGLGLRNLLVQVAAVTLAGAWLLRFWFASHMAHDHAVQLYPRTTWIIMYSLMILAVLGLMAVVDRGSGWAERTLRPSGAGSTRVIPVHVIQQVSAGLVCALALFATMGASWSVNRYMPLDPAYNTMGLDAWRAHTIKKANGACPKYSPWKTCADAEIYYYYDSGASGGPGQLFCANIPSEDWWRVCGRKDPWNGQPAPWGVPTKH